MYVYITHIQNKAHIQLQQQYNNNNNCNNNITTIVSYIQHKYNTKTNKNNYEFNNISLAAENSLKDVICFKFDNTLFQ